MLEPAGRVAPSAGADGVQVLVVLITSNPPALLSSSTASVSLIIQPMIDIGVSEHR